MSTYKLSDVTALNGNPVVQINNADSVLGAVQGSLVQIGAEQIVFLDSVDMENSQITLTSPWPYADAINAECTIAPNTGVSSLINLMAKMNELATKTQSITQVSSLFNYSSVSALISACLNGDIQPGVTGKTNGYHNGYSFGANSYLFKDATVAAARPPHDGGRYIHVGSNGFYLEGLFEDGKHRLSQYGAGRGDVAEDTAAIQALFGAIQDGSRVVVDVESHYSANDGVETNASGVILKYDNYINVDYIDVSDTNYSNKPYLLRVSAIKQRDLDINSGDIVEGDTFFSVTDATNVEPGDVIQIRSTEYFNGTDVVPGFPSTDKAITAKVRNVDGNTIHVFGWLTMSILAVNITTVEVFRGGSNWTVENPMMRGPGIQEDFLNGLGTQGIEFVYGSEIKLFAVALSGFQNRQIGFTNCYNSYVFGALMSSGLKGKCEKNFYGIMHQGGTNGYVFNAVGENMRRVADTGSGDPAVNIHHINITGTDCNGSAAGTHHCYNYFFNNLTALGSNGGGFTMRAKNITGHGLHGNLTVKNNGLGLGGAEDENASCGKVDIKGINLTTHDNNHVVKIFGNGEFDLEGTVSGGSVSTIIVQSQYVDRFKFRGTVDKLNSGILFRSDNPKKLENIDIQHVEFLEGNWADILLNAPLTMEARARNITVKHNSSTSNGKPHVLFETGCFEGLGIAVVDNKNTKPWSDIVTSFIDFGAARFTRAIEHYGNEYINYAALDGRTDKSPRILGEYRSVADIPAKVTLPRGSRIKIAEVGIGEHPEYYVTKGGTTGALTGVTGTINAGEDTLTLAGNELFDVDVGMIVVIVGAGMTGANLNTKVKDINQDGTEAVLNDAAGTSVTGAAMNYQSPDLTGSGLL